MIVWWSVTEAHAQLAGRGTGITIGSFDGVHLGHQAVLEKLRRASSSKSLLSLAITFDRHPAAITGKEVPPLLIPVAQRLDLLAEAGIDASLVLPFDTVLASLSPEPFIQDKIHGDLQARLLVVGYDFRFGAGGRGDVSMLRRLGQESGFAVEQVPPLTIAGIIVSSTAIRWILTGGDVALAGKYLGRPFMIEGAVIPGLRRGRRLGIPTANISTAKGILWPRYGVYIVEVSVKGCQNICRYGLANVGLKPTFGSYEPALEVHLLDFVGELYGQILQVHFLDFIRPQQKFPSIEGLRDQIQRDIEQARNLIRGRGASRSLSE